MKTKKKIFSRIILIFISKTVFAQSDEYTWIVDNCYKYGFIYRFQTNTEDLTGIRHEAWHCW